MKRHARQQLVRLGIFTILGIVVFALLVFTFRPLERAFQGGMNVRVHMASAAEIAKGTPVRYLGIPAGEVTSVEYAPAKRGGVIIGLTLRPGTEIHNYPGARPYVDSKLVTGEAYIEFPLPAERRFLDDYRAAPLLKDGDEVEGDYRATAPDVINQMSTQMGELGRTAGDTLREIRGVASDIRDEVRDLSGPIAVAAEGASKLLIHRPIDDPANPLKPGERNLSTVIQRLDQSLEGANALLADPKFRDDFKVSIANLRATTESLAALTADARVAMKRIRSIADKGDSIAVKLDRTIDRVDTVLDRQNANLDRVGQSIIGTSERLSAVLVRTEAILKDVGDGKGSLGRLLTDPTLFEQILKAAGQVNQTTAGTAFLISELTLHPGDYIQYGRRSTSDKERQERIRRALETPTTRPAGP